MCQDKETLKLERENEQTNLVLNKYNHVCQHSKKCDICSATVDPSKIRKSNLLLDVHEKVIQSGKYNFEGCRIPVNEKLNIQYIREMLHDYKDQQLCDFLEFGFPIGYTGNNEILKNVSKKDTWKFKNHKGAEEFKEDMLTYLQKESSNKAIIGPFRENPFKSGIKISPLNSIPKKDTTERRVIMDLSFPKGASLNDYVSKDEYLGEKIELVYPKVDDFIQLIKQKGRGCLLYKTDLRRAFRQLNLCPSSYNLCAFVLNKHIFCDCVLPMGAKSSAFLCQRFSNAISFILFKIGIYILNYLDDLASAETPQNAQFAFRTLQSVLEKCGIEEAKNKACPPSTIMTFIGVLFNTEKMTIEVTPERLNEIRILLRDWLSKETASIREIQSLLGKLNFIAACVRPGRIFVSRMLKWLKVLYSKDLQKYHIPPYVKKDILWWYKFLPTYNGVSMMLYEEWCEPDEIFSSDSCLEGCGGFWHGMFFHTPFPEHFKQSGYSINILEFYSIIICLKLWGQYFRQKRIQVFCDNLPVVMVINTGKSNCEMLQMCLREMAYEAAINQFEIRAVHLESSENRVADQLSRWDLSESHRQQFFDMTHDLQLTECAVSEELFKFMHTW